MWYSFLPSAGLITTFNVGIYPDSVAIVQFSPHQNTVSQASQAKSQQNWGREQVHHLNEQVYSNNSDVTEQVHDLTEQVHSDNFDLIAIILGFGCVAIRLLLMLEALNIVIELKKSPKNNI